MKALLFGKIAALFLVVSAAKAATTITGANYALGATGFATQVVTAAGQPFVTGTVMYGTFSSPSGLSSTVGEINLSSFGWTLFASQAFNTSANQPGLFGATGATGTLPTSATGPLVGNPIYAVIANAAGTDFIVWNTGKVFAQEVEGLGGAAVSFSTRDATTELIRGTVVPGGTNGLAGSIANRNGSDAVTFGLAIPEPSVALLGLLGAIGFFRRRR